MAHFGIAVGRTSHAVLSLDVRIDPFRPQHKDAGSEGGVLGFIDISDYARLMAQG